MVAAVVMVVADIHGLMALYMQVAAAVLGQATVVDKVVMEVQEAAETALVHLMVMWQQQVLPIQAAEQAVHLIAELPATVALVL
jgi:acetyl-CoA carboxylase alpha subunit